MNRADRARKIIALLGRHYPDATCALDWRDPYQLIVATILSAQCTDARVNLTTPALFERFPDAAALARAGTAELEGLVRSTGFYRNKAKSLLGMAKGLVERHGGRVPGTMEALVALPGVARKTANVVLGTAFGLADGIVVDTHVIRLANRMDLTREEDPVRIERDLMAVVPRDRWVAFAHQMTWHGRRICAARKPQCAACPLAKVCPSRGKMK
jgi:endonuclease-3